MIKTLNIYDGRDFDDKNFVGTITFDDENVNPFWRALNVVWLPGAFRCLDVDKSYSLIYEDTATMGSKDNGCLQNNCVDVDEDPHACQYCPHRTKGNNAYLFLPTEANVNISRINKSNDTNTTLQDLYNFIQSAETDDNGIYRHGRRKCLRINTNKKEVSICKNIHDGEGDIWNPIIEIVFDTPVKIFYIGGEDVTWHHIDEELCDIFYKSQENDILWFLNNILCSAK